MPHSTVVNFSRLNDTCDVKFRAATAASKVELSDLKSEFIQQCVNSALIMVDGGQNILDSNQSAIDLLAGQHGIENCDGVLKIKRGSVCKTVTQLVHQAVGGNTGFDATAEIIGIPDDSGRTRFAVRVLPCQYLGDPCALIMINDMLPETRVSQGVFAKLFSLSAREAEFAGCFALGSRVEQIASDMAISSNTARIHLRHLFLKTGCKNQAELARLFAKVPQVLGLTFVILQNDFNFLLAVQQDLELFLVM